MKFGPTFISGIVWILIALGIGVLGSRITGTVGWAVSLLGFGFAGLSIWHLSRITLLQWKGMRMMKEDPQAFAELRRSYEDASRRIEGSEDD